MNIETVANETELNKLIFKALSQRQRAVRVTSLTNLYRAIHDDHPRVSEKEFLQVFKQLDHAKMGNLIIGRRNKHNRFIWNYNLKDVAQMATGKLKQEEIKPAPKAKRVRRTRSQLVTIPGVKEVEPIKSSTFSSPRFQFDIVLSPTVSAKDIEALVELVKQLQNK